MNYRDHVKWEYEIIFKHKKSVRFSIGKNFSGRAQKAIIQSSYVSQINEWNDIKLLFEIIFSMPNT